MQQALTKIKAARIQIDRAIDLLVSGLDRVSAITLAGAAEEILGQVLERRGPPHALARTVAGAVGTYSPSHPGRKAVVDRANRFRNGLKHLGDGAPLNFDPEIEAGDLLDRAVENYFLVTHEETPLMVRFKEQYLIRRN